jgi:hypothetical protein
MGGGTGLIASDYVGYSEHLTEDGLHSIDYAYFQPEQPGAPSSMQEESFKFAFEIDGPHHFFTFLHPLSGDPLQLATGTTIARDKALEAQGWLCLPLDPSALSRLRKQMALKQIPNFAKLPSESDSEGAVDSTDF